MLGCALLAAGLHLPLLTGLHRPAPAAGLPAATRAMQVRELPPAAVAPAARLAPAAEGAPTAPATPPMPEAGPPPEFTPGPPELPLPDAELPAGGVTLRVYLVADEGGHVARVVARSLSDATPDAFRLVAEHALGDAHLQPAGAARAYCLSLRFDAALPAPQLGWLPYAAGRPERCLGGPAGPPRPLSR